jgi:hypothetical protein
MPKIRYSASSTKSKFSGGIFNKKIIAVPLGTTITNPFSGNWSALNVGSHFQMIPQFAPSWAGTLTGRRVTPAPQSVIISGVTGTNATAANTSHKMYFDGVGNYWLENINFTGTFYGPLSAWLPNAVLTIFPA